METPFSLYFLSPNDFQRKHLLLNSRFPYWPLVLIPPLCCSNVIELFTEQLGLIISPDLPLSDETRQSLLENKFTLIPLVLIDALESIALRIWSTLRKFWLKFGEYLEESLILTSQA